MSRKKSLPLPPLSSTGFDDDDHDPDEQPGELTRQELIAQFGSDPDAWLQKADAATLRNVALGTRTALSRIEQERDDARAHADKFPTGRKLGAVDDRTSYIDELIAANESARKPAALWKLATDTERRGKKESFLKRASERLNK
jgi:hypothetical protein